MNIDRIEMTWVIDFMCNDNTEQYLT
jgi:hypothetical protein